ncbi:unnamed protein product [Cochlearia groenlandica]
MANEKKKKKKHLHELLEDDQEPFHLNHYISDLRSQMGFSETRLKKRKSQNAAVLHHGLFSSCESSCFFAKNSPDPRKSPLFGYNSPANNNKKRENRVFLKIPARTAAILLEAAARIQKKQQTEKAKNRAKHRENAFGTLLKRLKSGKTTKPRLDNAAISLEHASSCSSGNKRRERFVEIDEDKCFCESPFRFVLHTSPSSSSSGHRTPHFTSAATSPARRSTEDEDSDETESLEKAKGQEEEEEEHKEEEDKEQCSPVSVLDPLEEEEEDDEDHHKQQEPDHLNILSCSFEVVQRAKRRLLKKLRRFEKLAGLDPVDLEGKMSSKEEEEEYEESEEDDNMRVYDSEEEYEDVDEAIARERGYEEEEKRKKNVERQRKWRMMSAWRLGNGAEEEVEEVVRKDVKGEAGEWRKHGGEVEETVTDLELSIFLILIDEFSQEFVSSCPI